MVLFLHYDAEQPLCFDRIYSRSLRDCITESYLFVLTCTVLLLTCRENRCSNGFGFRDVCFGGLVRDPVCSRTFRFA